MSPAVGPMATIKGDSGDNLLKGTGLADLIYGYDGKDTLHGYAGDDVLYGGAGADSLVGGGGNDRLYGEDGEDILDGVAGADTLSGGGGNDIFVVDDPGDVVYEVVGGGTDLVKSGITFSFAVAGRAELENLTLTGTGAINGTGNAKDNVLIGNGAANTLNGGAGNDRLYGGAGNDVLYGATGGDTLVGGGGDDTFVVDDPGDVVSEGPGGGSDLVKSGIGFSLAAPGRAELENLTLIGTSAINGIGNAKDNVLVGNGAANTLSGGAGNDRLYGGAGNDVLYGATGADTLVGGPGDDTFVVDDVGDVIAEAVGGGTDLVKSGIGFSLAAPGREELENLTLTGAGAISGTGNAKANVLTGNGAANTLNGGDGADTLDGGVGADTLVGGLGDDTFVVDNAGDIVSEGPGGGSDLVKSGIGFSLAAPGRAELENLTLTGAGAISGTGNAKANALTGNDGANKLFGLAGNDTLRGGPGDDTLDGGPGTDLLEGGDGYDTFEGDLELGDTVEGGNGFDRIVRLDLAYSSKAINLDSDAALNLVVDDGMHTLWIADVEKFSGVIAGRADDVLRLGFLGDTFITEYRGGAGTDLLTLDYSGTDWLGRTATGVTLSASLGDCAELIVQLSDGSSYAPVRLYEDLEIFKITGSAGADSLVGSTSRDTLRGGAGADTLAGWSGDDVLEGAEGADRLLGGLGDDRLTGGAGGDYLDGGGGVDITVYVPASGGVSVDLGQHKGLAGDALGDRLWNIEGVVGSPFADTLTGDSGNNKLYGAHGADTIQGLAGDDLIEAGSGPVFLGTYTMTRDMSYFYGDDGNDTIWGETHVASTVDPSYLQPAAIYGGNGDDALYNGLIVDGGPGNDYIYGGAINSTISGGEGADEIEATYGDHVVDAGAGDDVVWTEALHGGTNTVALGPGDDLGAVYSYDPQFAHTFDGGEGVDVFLFDLLLPSLTTGVELDALEQTGGEFQYVGVIGVTNFESFSLDLAGDHDDVVKLGNLGDFVKASDGDSYVLGRDGPDSLDGGYGADTILGGPGDDVVMGGSCTVDKTDIVRGGIGNDVVYGNFSMADFTGVARLYGDAGQDVFVFLPEGMYTPDRVMDFGPADDSIALYCGSYWYVDPWAREFEAIFPYDVTDNSEELRFTFAGPVRDDADHEIEVWYNKQTGALQIYDLTVAVSEWTTVCTVVGAPDLDVGDFLTMSEVFL